MPAAAPAAITPAAALARDGCESQAVHSNGCACGHHAHRRARSSRTRKGAGRRDRFRCRRRGRVLLRLLRSPSRCGASTLVSSRYSPLPTLTALSMDEGPGYPQPYNDRGLRRPWAEEGGPEEPNKGSKAIMGGAAGDAECNFKNSDKCQWYNTGLLYLLLHTLRIE